MTMSTYMSFTVTEMVRLSETVSTSTCDVYRQHCYCNKNHRVCECLIVLVSLTYFSKFYFDFVFLCVIFAPNERMHGKKNSILYKSSHLVLVSNNRLALFVNIFSVLFVLFVYTAAPAQVFVMEIEWATTTAVALQMRILWAGNDWLIEWKSIDLLATHTAANGKSQH